MDELAVGDALTRRPGHGWGEEQQRFARWVSSDVGCGKTVMMAEFPSACEGPEVVSERVRQLVEEELGTNVTDIVVTNDLTTTYQNRTDPTIADHSKTYANGGLTFLDREGRVVIAVSAGALPPSVSGPVGEFVVRHEAQHAKALMRGEDLRSTVHRRSIPPQSADAVYVALAAEIVDEFRAERATVDRCEPPAEAINAERLQASLKAVDFAADTQSFYDAWRASVVACAYIAGETSSTGVETPPEAPPEIAEFIAKLKQELTDVPDSEQAFTPESQDQLIDAVAVLLPDLLAVFGARIVERDGHVELEEI